MMKTYELTSFGLEHLALTERPTPQPAPNEVLIRFRAASLNYRDLMFAKGAYNPKAYLPAVPFSDGAGEIVEVGEGVTHWKVGDRVCPGFMPGWIDGSLTQEKSRTALGAGGPSGVLREFGVFREDALVRIPDHLSFEEGATLPCAALTAWNALVEVGALKAGDTVLTLGTGGVSIFALQLAKLHGARVIATSSSDHKLGRARELGADELINYRTTPDWDQEVLRLTGGLGADIVVEVGGAGTFARSANAACLNGLVVVIGVLSQGAGVDPVKILMKRLTVQGILVGSRRMFEDLCRAVSLHRLKPVIDRTFPFEEAPQSLAYLESGAHFGKVVVRI